MELGQFWGKLNYSSMDIRVIGTKKDHMHHHFLHLPKIEAPMKPKHLIYQVLENILK